MIPAKKSQFESKFLSILVQFCVFFAGDGNQPRDGTRTSDFNLQPETQKNFCVCCRGWGGGHLTPPSLRTFLVPNKHKRFLLSSHSQVLCPHQAQQLIFNVSSSKFGSRTRNLPPPLGLHNATQTPHVLHKSKPGDPVYHTVHGQKKNLTRLSGGQHFASFSQKVSHSALS